MKRMALGIMTGLYLAGCATTDYKEDLERIMQLRTPYEYQVEKETEELDLDEIVKPENRYHWTDEEHRPRSLRWYNPSLRTLEAGLERGDLGVVIFEDDKPILADKARVRMYPETRSATIEYKIDDIWYETVPSNPGNIDLNKGDEGGVYILNQDFSVWPDDPVEGFFYR